MRKDGGAEAGAADADAPAAETPEADGAGLGVPDAGVPEAGIAEAGVAGAGIPAAGTPEAGMPEAGMPEAGTPEAGMPEAGMPDAGAPAGGGTCAVPDGVAVPRCACAPAPRAGARNTGPRLTYWVTSFGSSPSPDGWPPGGVVEGAGPPSRPRTPSLVIRRTLRLASHAVARVDLGVRFARCIPIIAVRVTAPLSPSTAASLRGVKMPARSMVPDIRPRSEPVGRTITFRAVCESALAGTCRSAGVSGRLGGGLHRMGRCASGYRG